MYRAVIFHATSVSAMKHSVGEAPTPEDAMVKAGEEFFGSSVYNQLAWSPASGVVYWEGHIPCGTVWAVIPHDDM